MASLPLISQIGCIQKKDMCAQVTVATQDFAPPAQPLFHLPYSYSSFRGMIGQVSPESVPFWLIWPDFDPTPWSKDGSHPSVRDVLSCLTLEGQRGAESKNIMQQWTDLAHARPIYRILVYLGECTNLTKGTWKKPHNVAHVTKYILKPLLEKTLCKMVRDTPYVNGAPWNDAELMLQFGTDYYWIMSVRAKYASEIQADLDNPLYLNKNDIPPKP